jgi:lipoprotein-anchoring transpeptidase ErfK/SrfK
LDVLTRGPEAEPGHHDRDGHRSRALLRLGLAMLLLIGVAAGLGAWYEAAHARNLVAGIRIDGVDVGGMTPAAARRAIAAARTSTLSRPLIIRAAGRRFSVDPETLGVRVAVQRAVREAGEISEHLAIPSRVYHRVVPIDVSLDAPLAVGRPRVAAFVHRVARQIRRKPVNAEIAPSKNGRRLMRRHARPGIALDAPASVPLVVAALTHGRGSVTLPTRAVPPRVQQPDTTLTVDLGTNTLKRWKGFDVVARYPVGTAQKGFRTPTGVWRIQDKTRRPDWTNPDPNGWGADMPRHIPPGPDNPLGLRALYLDAPGIAIHGTPEASTVGGYVSHGCMRMLETDVKKLYPRVPIGTPVVIYGAPPWGSGGKAGVAGV